MVGFTYTRTSSTEDLADSVTRIAEFQTPTNQDEVAAQVRDIQETARQIEMAQSSIDTAVYNRLSSDTAQALADTNLAGTQLAAADNATKTDAANQTAGGGGDERELTAEERERFERGENIGSDDSPVAVAVSGINDDESSYDDGGEDVTTVDVSGGVGTNPLEQFLTYTYGISLHYMTMADYNLFITNKMPYTPKNNRVIIASGGRRNSYLVRNRNFELDMYITDFKMVTVIGVGTETKGTNSIQIEFTIIEPLSASFLERLVNLARENDIQAWIEMPLILQIDFFGQNEDGTYAETPLEGLSKFICVKLSDLRLEITPRGSEYKCLAIPVSHTALQKNAVAVPANFEVTAKTVGDFFASTGAEIGIDLATYENTAVTSGAATRDENNKTEKVSRPKGISTLSLADALNEFQRALVKGRPGKRYQDTADEYVFVIDKEIADSKIFVPDKHNLSSAPAQNDKTKNENIDINKGVIPINAGSNLIEVINQVIRSSEYFRQKIETTKVQGEDEKVQKNKPISIHKIIPRIEFLDEWDSIRKTYRKRITYYIKKYEYHNDKYPNTRKSIPERIERYYKYMYMQDNQQLRDLKIEFNTLWFQALTSFETKTAEDNLDIREEDHYGFDPSTGAGGFGSNRPIAATSKGKTSKAEIFPLKTLTTSTSKASNQLNDGSRKSVQAVDLWTSIFNKTGGDMVTLTLEIAGDPDFIKQDDVFFPPSVNDTIEAELSRSSDKRQLFIKLNFKIPVDINLDRGLYDFEKTNSSFSGIYEVILIENNFKNGAFTQRLTCNRLFNQEDDKNSRGTNDTALDAARDSSDSGGLEVSSEEYEDSLNQAALNEYEERESRTNTATNSQDQEPGGDPDAGQYAFYQNWETREVTDLSDLPFPSG